jgi:pyridoxal phosphate enzyme (YggS family)
MELDAAGVRLIAVSKYTSDAAISCLTRAGQRAFAESRPQALRDRARRFPDLDWHMIGPVQKNKAKYVARHATLWHSVEDAETAAAVARHVRDRPLRVLLQVNVAGLPHQHGVLPDQLPALYEQVSRLAGLEVVGLMCMAPRAGNARECFRRLRGLRDGLADGRLGELSMGMSGDFRIAVEAGATMVRLGSILFGAEVRDRGTLHANT